MAFGLFGQAYDLWPLLPTTANVLRCPSDVWGYNSQSLRVAVACRSNGKAQVHRLHATSTRCLALHSIICTRSRCIIPCRRQPHPFALFALMFPERSLCAHWAPWDDFFW